MSKIVMLDLGSVIFIYQMFAYMFIFSFLKFTVPLEFFDIEYLFPCACIVLTSLSFCTINIASRGGFVVHELMHDSIMPQY